MSPLAAARFVKRLIRRLDPRQVRVRRWRARFGVRAHPTCSLNVRGTFVAGPGASLGPFCTVVVADDSKVTLGDGVWINDNCLLETLPGQSIYIGNRTTLQSRCQIRGDVEIGDDVLLAQNVFVSSGSHQYDYAPELRIRMQDRKYVEDHGFVFSDRISIGTDSWLGINTVIMAGVTVGDGCVVGANAVVVETTDPYTIVGGVPARFLKHRPH